MKKEEKTETLLELALRLDSTDKPVDGRNKEIQLESELILAYLNGDVSRMSASKALNIPHGRLSQHWPNKLCIALRCGLIEVRIKGTDKWVSYKP